MITLIARLKAKPGQEGLLAEIAAGLAKEVREKEQGCLMYIPHIPINNPGEIVFIEKYADEDAFSLHRTTPHFKAAGRQFKELLEGPPEITVLKELEL